MIPDSSYPVISEDDAFASAISFFEQLHNYPDVSFVLENVYPPGIGWEEIGYDPSHFSIIDPEGCFEFCLDTGHLNLSPFGLMDFLSLPNELTCMHLHSNDGLSDQHLPLTRSNFSEWSILSSQLKQDKYIVVEVKHDLENVRRVVEGLQRNEIVD
jgi:sugar phosphate isomerase/epimerase